MKKTIVPLLSLFAFFLVGVSVVRKLYNVDFIHFQSFLTALESIDVDFNIVISYAVKISQIWDSIVPTDLSNLQLFFDNMIAFFQVVGISLCMPIFIIGDLLEFLYSLVRFFVVLVGFNPFA